MDVVSRLTARKPSDWFSKESFTLLAPDGQANVIYSSEPLDPTIDTDHYASVQGELLEREFPGYRQHGELEEYGIGNVSGRLREFSWTPPDGVTVRQIQLYAAYDGQGWTATATTPEEHYPAVRQQLMAILSTIAVRA
ncbi:DcrB-related protein [Agromyces sp. MMS24-JH15]|uniref:DcrB-related protein n=1 Tax=Agromyces sp. MMS24-JH15 TaxID=3243765 RepID=UPI003748ECD3